MYRAFVIAEKGFDPKTGEQQGNKNPSTISFNPKEATDYEKKQFLCFIGLTPGEQGSPYQGWEALKWFDYFAGIGLFPDTIHLPHNGTV